MNNSVRQVIEIGLKLMQKEDISNNMYKDWIEYSKLSLLEATDNIFVYSNYLSVILEASIQDLDINKKLSMCLYYLIKILPII